MVTTLAGLAGAMVGLGLVLIVTACFEPAADRTGDSTGLLTGWGHRAASRLATTDPHTGVGRLARVLLPDRRRPDLALLQEAPEAFLLHTLVGAVAGLALPGIAALVAVGFGAPLGAGLPVATGLVLAGLLATAPTLRVRQRAARARLEMRRAVCAVLDLVALERAADAGPVEAVERAVAISDTVPFARLRQTLTHAQLAGHTPWRALRDLSDAIGVAELGDLADIMASSGRDGAAVCTSLRARATTLRATITAADTAAANARSEYMVIPVAALGLIFIALLAYPALARLASGT